MADTRRAVERPLSPHLSIYRPMLTMTMSIIHRITGAALFFGTLLLTWWLLAAASGPTAYAKVQAFMGSIIGMLILFGYTWALIHHMLGGIRHLIWDTGRGFGPVEREWLTLATLIGSVGLTLLIWIIGFMFVGGTPMNKQRLDAHAAVARALPRLGPFRHRSFLEAARNFGRAGPAHHHLRLHRDRAARPQPCRAPRRSWDRPSSPSPS